jgi:hypothetical protein
MGIAGVSAQKLILPSPHIGFLLANFRDSDNPIGLSCVMIRLSIIDRFSQILGSPSVFRKNCSNCSDQERIAYRREAPKGD